MTAYRAPDSLGISRSIEPSGVLPQQAQKIDASLPIAADEILIEVESLNIDSASFKQIRSHCESQAKGDRSALEQSVAEHVQKLVLERGKLQNPVTGSGGMLIGRVQDVGPEFPAKEKPVAIGDRVATLVSLTLTPLSIRKVKKVHLETDRVDIEGHAILFASGIFARLPKDIPDTVSLAALDVAGAPAQTARLVRDNQTVVVIGGGGKSGLLCLYEAKKKDRVTTIAVDYSEAALERARALGLADHCIQVDARKSVEVMEKIWSATRGRMADIVINVANLPDTEMSSVLSAKKGGIVYFFSMATSFTRAALGAEGVGADVDLRIGNGYTEGHADLTLNILRESPAMRELFEKVYGG